jgi:large subunit ribosomal protein L21
MYAVVSSGGKQYRVEPGSTLTMERLAADGDESVTFDRVLLVGDGDTVTVGTPTVSGATVSATILGEELGPKIVVFKFKQKVKYRRRTGHRQHLVRVRIDGITANGRTVSAEEAPAKATPAKPRRRAAAAKPAPVGAAAETDDDKPKRARSASAKAPARRAAAGTAKDDAKASKPARRTTKSTKTEPKE